MRVLVVGGSGFVGRAVVRKLIEGGHELACAVRRYSADLDPCVEQTLIDGLTIEQQWIPLLKSQQVVVQLAARVHVMDDLSADPLTEYRKVNVQGTLRLARQAADAGVKRFIFISSIKVNGESTEPGRPFSAESLPAPVDPYGISKREAEQALESLALETGMEVVIIRPVLVYGPAVQANFQNMMHWLYKGVPLPFASIDKNRRSLVALENLSDLIFTCLDHPKAANQTFLASDGEDLSTAELLSRVGMALNKPARLIPIPGWILRFGAAVIGRQELAQRLCGSLQVDITKTRSLLGWSPPVSVEKALRQTADDYLMRRIK